MSSSLFLFLYWSECIRAKQKAKLQRQETQSYLISFIYDISSTFTVYTSYWHENNNVCLKSSKDFSLFMFFCSWVGTPYESNNKMAATQHSAKPRHSEHPDILFANFLIFAYIYRIGIKMVSAKLYMALYIHCKSFKLTYLSK